MTTLTISYLESVKQTQNIETASFSSFRDFANDLTHVLGPKGPLMCAAVFENPQNGGRKDSNIARMGRTFIGDIDGCTDVEAEQLLDRTAGVSCVLHTSHSHGLPGKGNRLRIIIELDREYTKEEFYPLFDAINARLGGIVDKNTRKPSQPYYYPTHPEDSPEHFIDATYDQAPWSVDELLSEAPTKTTTEPTRLMSVAKEDLSELAAQLMRRVSPKMKQQGRWLNEIARGEPYAQDGERDDRTFLLACTLVDEWPDLDPRDASLLFATSLEQMPGKTQSLTVEDVEEKLFRRKVEKDEEREEVQKERLSERQMRISESFNGTRDYPVTKEELAALTGKYGDALRHSYIVSKNRVHFLLRPDGSYRPVPVCSSDLTVAAHRDLSVFPHIHTEYTTQNGDIRRKKPPQLCEDYGTTFDSLHYDLTVQGSSFDPFTGRMVLAPCTWRVEAREHPEVQTWLELLGEKAVDLAAAMYDFGHACGATVLVGEKAGGKTLYALLAARAIGDGPTHITDLTTRFNAPLARMPIVFADESLGEQYRRTGSVFLRELLSTTEHTVEEKYMPKATMHGALRLIVAVNRMSALETHETVEREDSDALGQRLVHIHVTAEASKYLDTLGGRPYIQEHWLNQRKGSEHFRWLFENHAYEKGKRFLVEGEPGILQDSMVSSMGVAGQVTDWLLNHLSEMVGASRPPLHGILVREGELYAQSRIIHKEWNKFAQNIPPSQNLIGRALSSISERGRAKFTVGGKTMNFYQIRKQNLLAALERHDLTLEGLEEVLREDAE